MFELTEPQRMIQEAFRQYCEKELAPHVDALEKGEANPFDLMRQMLDTFGMRDTMRESLKRRVQKMRCQGTEENKAEEKEGEAEDPLEMAQRDMMIPFVMIKELCRVAPGFAMSFGVSTALCGQTILGKGTPDQIEKYAIPVICLDKVGCWALTEPEAGSDAFGSMKSVARPDGDDFILNGAKTFITNAPYGDVFLVYVKIDRGQPKEKQPVHAFILDREMEGLTTGKPFEKMGMKDSPTGEVFMDDVRVPKANLLGTERDNIRDQAKESLGNERSGVPAMCLGIIEKCLEESIKYAKERKQFGRPIGEFQAIQLKIANMYIRQMNVQNIVYRLAWMGTNRKPDMAFVCATKAYCAQAAIEVALDAMQVFGGYGYMKEYHIEKLLRDAKLLELGAGTTDINLLTTARILLKD
jgi:alkylation response protein AidB-like acyl-CoA dehydrogenase